MHIESIRIQNFRSFLDETIILNDYSCFVGANGAGKSTVLCALNAFFRETENSSTNLQQLDQEDFHLKRTDKPIRITVTFSNLSDEAKNDFSDYYRHGKLIVTAEAKYNSDTLKAEIRQFGNRLVMQDFAVFFEAYKAGAKIAELKQIFEEIQKNYTDLSAESTTKDGLHASLRAYEEKNPTLCELIESEDQFYGFSKGANRLAQYVQWVYVPAVKDTTSEQVESKTTALGKLLARTVRSKIKFDEDIRAMRVGMQQEYQKLLDKSQGSLDGITKSLQGKIVQWAHPKASLKLEWKQDLEKSVKIEEPWAHIIAGEGDFNGALARFGHGLQRSYFLALLHEISSLDDAGPKLILGCEEPELYQHPPQARHLAKVLETLSKKNSQIIISTHSPLFISGEGFENVRMVRKDESKDCSLVARMTFDELAAEMTNKTGEKINKPTGALAKIHTALQPHMNEMFFTRKLILVEGIEDIAYISSYMHLLERDDEYRAAGFHMISANGKSEIIKPLIIANHFGIPTFTIFDTDANKPDRNGSIEKHRKDNLALLKILGAKTLDPMPTDTIEEEHFVAWSSDIGTVVENDIGAKDWAGYQNKADALYGHVGSLRKNPLHIGASLALAWDEGKKSSSLEGLCDKILQLGKVAEVQTKAAA